MIRINKHPGQRVLELGGGDAPNPAADCNVDVRHGPKVDFAVDFNEPLPIQDDEWDCVLSHFAIEHVSYRKVPQLLAEIRRVLKPGGKVVIAVPDTEAQFRWIMDHPEGWDGRDFFEAASGLLFGDQDYSENCHKSYWSKDIAIKLFQNAGFVEIKTCVYGERNTDIVIEATKPVRTDTLPSIQTAASITNVITPVRKYTTEEMYDRYYFNGGSKVGGYANEGYRDFPVHEITFRHVLARDPQSVLEIGPARGYILKRLQDHGIPACGLEVSRHCWLTRACNGILHWDVCQTPWPWKDKEFDLCFSIAVLEHIPEDRIAAVLSEMKRVSKRGLHGIDFGEKNDGFDKTHVTLKPKDWWETQFRTHCDGQRVMVCDKEDLERGEFPRDVLHNDGLLKLNLGSHMVMFHYGWINMDVCDLHGFAQVNGYLYQQHDLRNGVPYATGSVDCIVLSHVLEHFSYKDGLSLLNDCRRAIKPTGCMRIAVPDARLLNFAYAMVPNDLNDFDHVNEGCAAAPTAAGKLWALLHEGHASQYDADSLHLALRAACFEPLDGSKFRIGISEMGKRIVKETIDMFPCLSLYVEAVPRTK